MPCAQPRVLSWGYNMADQAWKKLSDKIKAKRTKKQFKDNTKKVKGEKLTVQRLSADVSGKAQKYCCIGPREFVPFGSEQDLSIENIKIACEKHFSLGRGLKCDVLAGEQGPCCKATEQIPNMKVIYLRFISTNTDDDSPVIVDEDIDLKPKIVCQ